MTTISELEAFRLEDAVKFHDDLNPNLWIGKHLDPKVRKQLLLIAEDFITTLGISDIDVKDITVSGSNAAYSYTPHSDLDLHILVDIDKLQNNEIYRELFTAKKTLYNDQHDITVHDVPVEVYVQNSNEPVVSLGEYSVVNDKWIKIPKKQRANFDQAATKAKYNSLAELVDLALKTAKMDRVSKVIETIRRYRKAGLAKGGEFSPENLAYKAVRAQGGIDALYDLRDKLHSRKLSLEEAVQTKAEAIKLINKIKNTSGRTESEIEMINHKIKRLMQEFRIRPDEVGMGKPIDPMRAKITAAASERQQAADMLKKEWERFKRSLFTEEVPSPENSRKTQIASTLPTYRKAAELLSKAGAKGRGLDFGAGLGLGTGELGADTDSYEPFPDKGFEPNFVDVNEIPDNFYHRLVSLNVLNVVPNTVEHRGRDLIVKNIGRVLAPGGIAIITARGRDVLTIKGTPGEEPMSFISKMGTYQKGFTPNELKEYVQEVLGDGFEVTKIKLGPAGIMIKKTDTGVEEDYDPNGPPPGPEFKPTMPAGTVRVDVSDVYDWYKLGQHISNMKGLGKHDFGQGPPSTIFSFGDEDTEHKYIQDLEKTGLTTTDIDPIDPNQPKGMKRQKTDPTYNVNETADRKAAVLKIQKHLNKKYGANLDLDGKLGPLTLKSINKFMPRAKTGLADEPDKTTAVQGKKLKETGRTLRSPVSPPSNIRETKNDIVKASTVQFKTLPGSGKIRHSFRVIYDGKVIARGEVEKDYAYDDDDRGASVQEIVVYSKYRRMGIASKIYDAIELTFNYKLHPSDDVKNDGQEFWKARSNLDEAYTSKQQVIDHFVRMARKKGEDENRAMKMGASAWERGWRGPKPKESEKPKEIKPYDPERYPNVRLPYRDDDDELTERRSQEIIHTNPKINTIKSLARNNKYGSARFTIDKDGNLNAGDSVAFVHRDLEPAYERVVIRGYINFHDGNYNYRTMGPYDNIPRDHPILRRLEKAGIENGNIDKDNLADSLNEALDSRPYPYEQSKLESSLVKYHFETDKGLKYDVVILSSPRNPATITVSFHLLRYEPEWGRYARSMDITHSGDARRVFATVIDIVKKYADARTPERIVFTAEEPSRVRLYDAFLKRVDREMPDYQAVPDLPGKSSRCYMLERKPKKIDEASGYIPSAKEKNDPRFKTALTVDIRPDAIKKNAKAFNWKTSRAGIPPQARADGKIK
jgi:SAM-dependent methyltransferase